MQGDSELSGIGQIVDKAYKILVVSGDVQNEDIRIARQIVAQALDEKGKEVRVSPAGGQSMFEAVPERSVTLKFNYQGKKVERLQYRINENEVELKFTPFTDQLTPEAMHVSYLSLEVDAIFALGIANREALPEEIQAYGIKPETPIINCDIRAETQEWGNVNIIMKDVPLYALLAVSVIEQFGGTLTDHWQQMVMMKMKEDMPQLANATPRLLRMVAGLMEA